jgi:hypothetical protein
MMMMMMMMMPWGCWPAAAAHVPGWGVPEGFEPPPLPGWQPVQHVGQQAQAAQKAGGSLAPVAPMTAGPGSGNAKRQRKQVTTKAKQQVLVEAADRGDEDDDACCSSDDDWVDEQVPAAAGGGSQQIAKIVYKVGCCFLLDANTMCEMLCRNLNISTPMGIEGRSA